MHLGGTKELLIQTSLGGHEVCVTKLTNHAVILDWELTDAHLFNKRQSYRKIIKMLNQRMFSLGMSIYVYLLVSSPSLWHP